MTTRYLPILRVARATNDLESTSQMYRMGLGYEILAQFKDHQGFDGVILGHRSAPYHLEFTHEHGKIPPRANSHESLLVFYIPDVEERSKQKEMMMKAGFREVPSANPYWDVNGTTFEDAEGYRVVLSSVNWSI